MFSKYDKSYPYLIACSGGPDSMALLDMLLKDNFNIIIAHVNYKTRDESDAEEAMVKEKLKNKGEISNICDEIILRINELKENFGTSIE